MNKILLDFIKDCAADQPDRLFAADVSGAVTYGEAWETVVRGAARFKERGIRMGERILIDCTQDRFFLLAVLSCQMAGAVSVPLEAEISEDKYERIRTDTGAVMRVIPAGSEQPGCKEYENDGVRNLTLEELFQAKDGADPGSLPGWPSPEMTAEILYTTGTTGKSKGIELTHANNLALAENIISGTKMHINNIELVPLPLSHSHGLRTCYANFMNRGGVVITNGVSQVKGIYDLIKRYQVTALDLSPTAAAVLLKLSRGAFSIFNGQLDYIEIGTSALPDTLKSELTKQFANVRLYNFYGSTESGRSCALNFNSPDDSPHCIGYPTKNAQFLIVDADGREIRSSERETGCLACQGSMNMKGYWNEPALTASVLRDGILYTQDEGYIDAEGRVFCLGRKDDVVNYRGIKIAPEEIEEKAASYPGVADCALIGLDDPSSGQIPILCYKEGPDGVDEEAFYQYLSERIMKDYLPKRLFRCLEIPRTAGGKLRRAALKQFILENGSRECM